MSYLSDTLTLGVVMVLLFGSIALYLYTRLQQAEQKVGLLESIVLDLKLTSEVQSFSPVPDLSPYDKPSSVSSPASPASPVSSVTLTPLNEESEEISIVLDDSGLAEYKAAVEQVSQTQPQTSNSSPSVTAEYDQLSLKELQSLGRSRGISLEKGAKKAQWVEALKRKEQDETETVSGLSSSTILETSATISDEE